MENEMRSISEDLRLCLQELKRNLFVLCLLTLLGLIVGVLGSLFIQEHITYQASACIYNARYSSSYESAGIDHFLQNTELLVQSNKIAENAVSLLGETDITAREIQESVSAQTEEDSIVVWIVAESYTPQRAVQIVNAFTEALTAEMKTIASSDNIQVLEYAASASRQSSLSMPPVLIIAVVAVAFLIVGCAVFALRVLLSDRVLSLDQCTLNGQIHLLGVIPEIPKTKGETSDRGSAV